MFSIFIKSRIVKVCVIMQHQHGSVNTECITLDLDSLEDYFLPELIHEVNRLAQKTVQRDLLSVIQKFDMKPPSELLTEEFEKCLTSKKLFRPDEAEKIINVWKSSESKFERV